MVEGDGERLRRLRLLSRLAAAFVLDVTSIIRGDADLTDALLATVIIQVNTADVQSKPELRAQYSGNVLPPDELRRPVSIKAIAASLNLPFETVRRRVHALIDLGFCRMVEGGVIVPAQTLADPLYAAAAVAGYARARAFYLELQALDLLGPQPAPAIVQQPGPAPERAVARLVGAFILRVVEAMAMIGELVDGVIILETFRSNTAHFPTHMRGEEGFSAQDMVPDELRHPISIACLAQKIGVPRETVRRHVAGLLRKGFLERRADGLIVPAATLAREPVLPSLVTASSNLNRLFAGLGQLGVLALWDAEAAAAETAATA